MSRKRSFFLWMTVASFLLIGSRADASEIPAETETESETEFETETEVGSDTEFEAEEEDLHIYQLGYLGEAPVASDIMVAADDVEETVEGLIYDSLSNVETELNLEEYGISYDVFKECCEGVVNAHPEIFYLSGYKYYSRSSDSEKIVTRVIWNYMEDNSGNQLPASQILTMKAALQQKKAEALSLLEEDMTDLQAALALHDYLALSIEYTYPDGSNGDDTVYSAYGALVEGEAVCQGYALAYIYLLNEVGIPNMFVASSSMDHGWNLISVGGNWYHVDITWDDQGGFGKCSHANFLLNDFQIKSTAHTSWDTDTPEAEASCSDTFWKGISGGLFYDTGNWYYFNEGCLNVVDESGQISAAEDSGWTDGSTWAWNSGQLYANDSSTIIAVDFSDCGKEIAANMEGLGYEDDAVLQGIEIRGNYLYCRVNGNVSQYAVSDLQAGNLYKTETSGGDSGGSGDTSGGSDGKTDPSSSDRWIDDYTRDDPVKLFVARFYCLIMERDYDREGLDYWVSALKSRKCTGAQLADKFIMSQEFLNKNVSDTEFVNLMYRTCMGREADSDGRDYWVSLLRKGVSYRYILKGFAGSAEFRQISGDYGITAGQVNLTENRDQNVELSAFVARCYEKVMLRTPDAEGMNYWTGLLLNGKITAEQTARKFVLSSEFVKKNYDNKEFIKILYQVFMGREYDQEGLEYWLNRMQKGDTRTQILSKFASSKEFQNIMRSFGLS